MASTAATVSSRLELILKIHESIGSSEPTAADFDDSFQTQKLALETFNGYYNLTSGDTGELVAVCIDTNVLYKWKDGKLSAPSTVTINLLWGQGKSTSASQFVFNPNISFVDNVLTLPKGFGKLTFERSTADYVVGKIKGFLPKSVEGASVSNHNPGEPGALQEVEGINALNPVPLRAYVGKYYLKPSHDQPKQLALEISDNFDGVRVSFAEKPGHQLTEVDTFGYNRQMYLLTFTLSDKKSYFGMLGTAGKAGLACQLMGPGSDQTLVSSPS